MSDGVKYLHSHSGLERELKETAMDKFHVLVDEEWKDLFPERVLFRYCGVTYYKVPTWLFVRKGGVFKNFAK